MRPTFNEVRTYAQQGNMYAQCDLGDMYRNGVDVAKNDQEAFRWYRLAADQGFARAQERIGTT